MHYMKGLKLFIWFCCDDLSSKIEIAALGFGGGGEQDILWLHVNALLVLLNYNV